MDQNDCYDETCELCQAEKLTEWLYEDAMCWIAYCDSCNVPMVVFKPHREPEKEEAERMVAIAKRLYPNGILRFWRGQIPYHYHFHCFVW